MRFQYLEKKSMHCKDNSNFMYKKNVILGMICGGWMGGGEGI